MRYCSKTENTMTLLGGALLGAAAMYLLDPEAGRRRREYLRESAGDALGRAGEAIGPTIESLSERTRDVGGRLAEGAAALGAGAASAGSSAVYGASHLGSAAAERASDAASTARDTGADWLSGIGDAVSSFGHRFTKGARSYSRSAADSARDARDSAWYSARDYASRAATGVRGRLPWHEEEESHAGAYTAAGLTAAALGAGMIYLLDPVNGRRRRKLAVDQVNRIVNDTGRCMRQTGRYVNDIMNRSRGMAHEARSRFTAGGDVSPETLMQRVRSEMGHVVTNAGAISVMVDNNRDVTLTGRVLSNELDALLTTVNKVPGVNQIINRLDVQDSPEAVTGGDAGQHAGQRL